MKRFTLVFLFLHSLQAALFAAPSRVKVVKGPEGWQMLVNNQPFFIKGVGCNRAQGEKGEDYLLMARDLGANAVRTWGDAPRAYLDQAEKYGLKVDLGVWLNPIRNGSSENYRDAGHREGLKNLILSYVREMKDHPALLSWNIGNEVFAYTESDDEKKAFGEFLEELTEAVHLEDPNHPVIYASADIKDLPEVKKYVPSLDIVGINTYGSLSPSLGWVRQNGFDRPIVVTEFGPLGAWDSTKDKNDAAFDPSDQFKATNYASLWRQIESAKGRCIGGFAFVLGEQRNSDSLSWWNINFGDLRRDAYWTLYEGFTKLKPDYRAPKISQFIIENSTGLAAGSRIFVRVVASAPEGQALRYTYFITSIVSDPLIVEPPRYYPVELEEVSPGRAQLKVPDDPGIYRVYTVVMDEHKNAAVADRSIRVLPR